MVVGVRHVVVGTLGVAAVVKGGIWLLDSTIWLQQPHGGVQETDATFDDGCYTEGAYYHVTDADDQE